MTGYSLLEIAAALERSSSPEAREAGRRIVAQVLDETHETLWLCAELLSLEQLTPLLQELLRREELREALHAILPQEKTPSSHQE